jgi:hypothetical protein
MPQDIGFWRLIGGVAAFCLAVTVGIFWTMYKRWRVHLQNFHNRVTDQQRRSQDATARVLSVTDRLENEVARASGGEGAANSVSFAVSEIRRTLFELMEQMGGTRDAAIPAPAAAAPAPIASAPMASAPAASFPPSAASKRTGSVTVVPDEDDEEPAAPQRAETQRQAALRAERAAAALRQDAEAARRTARAPAAESPSFIPPRTAAPREEQDDLASSSSIILPRPPAAPRPVPPMSLAEQDEEMRPILPARDTAPPPMTPAAQPEPPARPKPAVTGFTGADLAAPSPRPAPAPPPIEIAPEPAPVPEGTPSAGPIRSPLGTEELLDDTLSLEELESLGVAQAVSEGGETEAPGMRPVGEDLLDLDAEVEAADRQDLLDLDAELANGTVEAEVVRPGTPAVEPPRASIGDVLAPAEVAPVLNAANHAAGNAAAYSRSEGVRVSYNFTGGWDRVAWSGTWNRDTEERVIKATTAILDDLKSPTRRRLVMDLSSVSDIDDDVLAALGEVYLWALKNEQEMRIVAGSGDRRDSLLSCIDEDSGVPVPKIYSALDEAVHAAA